MSKIGIGSFAVAALLFSLAVGGLASAIHYRFSPAGEFPGSSYTVPLGDSITNIVGYYIYQGGQFGYVQTSVTSSHTPFLSLQPPGGWFSFAGGVNALGAVVGGYCVPPQQCNCPETMHGFSYSNGAYKTIDYPGAASTGAYGISDPGQIVGGYCDSTSTCAQSLIPTQHAFVENNGTFKELDYPGAQATQAYGINKAGTVVGIYEINNDGPHSFLYQNGQYKNIDFPGAVSTHASAINNKGIVAGYYEQANAHTLGFVYQSGQFYPVSYPGASGTSAAGINDKDVIVGVWAPPMGLVNTFKAVPVR